MADTKDPETKAAVAALKARIEQGPRRIRVCPVHLVTPDDSRNNCWCGRKPIWYFREDERNTDG